MTVHRALYSAFDQFPSRKGAAIHIDRFSRTLFARFGGGLLHVMGGQGIAAHQVEDEVEIVRFSVPIANVLERALAFSAHLDQTLDRLASSLKVVHVRDPWSALAATRPGRTWATVFEVNALPSIELPTVYDLSRSTIERLRTIELECLDRTDLIVTPSHTTSGFLESIGTPASKIRVIPNGADIPPPAPRPEDAPPDYILYFGALQAWQGVETLFRAFARLLDFPDLGLVLCASAESKRTRFLARFAEKLGIGDRLVWRFALDEPALAGWRQHALLSIAPFAECERNVVQGCSPLKVLESMASGVCVVASDIPPVRELIEHRLNGWLVHPDRPPELARAIRILIENPAVRMGLAAEGRRNIERQFSWSTATDSLTALYDELMESAENGGRHGSHENLQASRS